MKRFLESNFRKLLRTACMTARESPGREICGLIIDTKGYLHLIQTKNISRRLGSWQFSAPEIRKLCAAAKLLEQEVAGTFHSHPVGLPTPGSNDIKYAVNDSLMLIFDCYARKAKLWKIKNRKANGLKWRTFNL